jgi:hypothetical protein
MTYWRVPVPSKGFVDLNIQHKRNNLHAILCAIYCDRICGMDRQTLLELANLVVAQRAVDGSREGRDKDLIKKLQARHPSGKYSKLNASTITRWKSKLEERGVLTQWCDYNAIYRGEAHSADREEFKKSLRLKEAIVVRPKKGESFLTEIELLFALGNHAADEVRKAGLFSEIRHLAIGSGRTLIRYAESIMNRPPAAENLTVSPISGRIWLGDFWSLFDKPESPGELESALDSDFAAHNIARGLHLIRNPNIRVSQIAHFAYSEEEAAARATVRGRCAFQLERGWNWGLPGPDRIVAGVASLSDEAHPLRKLIEHSQDKEALSPEVSPIVSFGKELLKHLNFAAEARTPGIGEMSLRMFPVLPLPQDLEEGQYTRELDAYRAVADRIRALNARTIAISPQHLKDCCLADGRVQLIAGGASKLRLLWTLLLPNLFQGETQQLINSVCTDLDSAQVLSRAADFVRASEPLRDSYRELLAVLDC